MPNPLAMAMLLLGTSCAAGGPGKAGAGAPPAAASQDGFGVEIAYRDFARGDSRTRIPLVPVSVGGRSLEFVFDTGSGLVLLPKALAQELALAQTIPELKVGAATLSRVPFAALDRFELADGDLGCSAYRELIVRLDLPRRTLTFFKEAQRARAVPSGAPWVEFTALPGRHEIFLSVTVAGSAQPTLAFFDTGSSSAKIAHDEFARLAGDGPVPSDATAMLESITLPTSPEPTVLSGVEVLVSRASDRFWQRGKAPATLQLGCQEFRDYVVTIDYPTRRLYFSRTAPGGR